MPRTKQSPIGFSRSRRNTSIQDKQLDYAVIQIGRKKEPKTESDSNEPTVQQEHLDETERLLKSFDLNLAYGPCIGITRLQRWERAYALGQKPPGIVKEILVNDKTQKYNQSLFDEYKMI